MLAAGPWEWGWDALVAIGTLALAAGTVVLAWSTRATAKATVEEVRAQWRPAVVPAEDLQVDYVGEDGTVVVAVRNVGRGAAYHVDVALEHGKYYLPASAYPRGAHQPVGFTVLPVGEVLELKFEDVESPPVEGELVIDYEDLNGRPYASRIELRNLVVEWGPPTVEVLRMARVTLADGHQLVPWNDPANYAS